jgi:hypothetical protein
MPRAIGRAPGQLSSRGRMKRRSDGFFDQTALNPQWPVRGRVRHAGCKYLICSLCAPPHCDDNECRAQSKERRKIFLRSDERAPPHGPLAKRGAARKRNVTPPYFRRAFFGAARPDFTGAVILKSSSFLPVFSAAASHRGLRPRPAHVSVGLSGLRYFGATVPCVPPRTPLLRAPRAARRSSLLSCS